MLFRSIEAFHKSHTHLDPNRPMEEPTALLDEARTVLRPKFLAADVGITGANFMIAETGSTIIVTNEGNGDLTQILPNALSPVIVMASLMIASAILLESALSFLGLGDPNMMSWGYMIGASRSVIRNAWWMSTFPGVAILVTVLALNLVGEGLSDAMNPRLARKGRA